MLAGSIYYLFIAAAFRLEFVRLAAAVPVPCGVQLLRAFVYALGRRTTIYAVHHVSLIGSSLVGIMWYAMLRY